nr:GNAT family N-acetyltransferase [Euzebya pacifica]
MAAFVARAVEHLRTSGCVTIFDRIHPFLDKGVESLHVLRSSIDTVSRTFWVDLRKGADSYWDAAKGRHRTAVRKARSSGLEIDIKIAGSTSLSAGSDFVRLYNATMDRVAASSSYRYEADYYRSLERLGQGGHLVLATANSNKDAVAAALFLTAGRYVHYFLAGSLKEGARLGVNNLLIDGVVRWAIDEGFEWFELGGGVRPGDSLAKFKHSIADVVQPFCTARLVLNDELFRQKIASMSGTVDYSFFPPYANPEVP